MSGTKIITNFQDVLKNQLWNEEWGITFDYTEDEKMYEIDANQRMKLT